MAKKVALKKVETIASAVAIHLATRDVPCTAKQCLQELLEQVKTLVSQKLKMDELQLALSKWVDRGWAIITDGYLQITRAGRNVIRNLAENATSPPIASATM
jgi:coproporphyrinogen III oxidase-like Fe-S oxidoreductase